MNRILSFGKKPKAAESPHNRQHDAMGVIGFAQIHDLCPCNYAQAP
jgi:hypothetical protein